MTSFTATTVEDEEMERVLRAAGIDSAPMDPSSVDALRQLVREKNGATMTNDRKLAATTDAKYKPPPSRSTFVTIDNKRLERSPSDLTQPETASNNSNTNANANTIILEQLQFQTSLMLSMQKQIEALTSKVDRLERGGGVSAASPQTYTHSTTTRYYRDAAAPPLRPPVVPEQQQQQREEMLPPQHARQQQQQEHQPRAVAAGESWLRALLLAPVRTVRTSRVAEIARLFWVRRGNHVRDLDGGMLFKIMFMLLVVTARMNKQPGASKTRFYASIAFMVVGFLWHTRYLQYVYQFVWTDQIPARIWNGQPADGPPPVPPHPHNHRQPAAAAAAAVPNNQNNDWRNTFLGGGIRGRPENPLIALVQDIAYLFGSFVFSIFPMWRPEGPPPPPPQEPLLPNNEQQQQQPQDGMRGIPPVRPPRDAMEAAEDEDE